MTETFSTTVTIDSGVDEVWNSLTKPDLMAEWMGEPDFEITVDTDWRVNSTISIQGFHHVKFENTGTVLEYKTEKKLKYTHLSSLSRLPDKPENHSILEFNLRPIEERTQLTLTIENFPTESIRKHLEFYWKATIMTIKRSVELRARTKENTE
jgi:uncharacterized protein YndB with AHSA1/START domain